ncbi:MAG: O-antigen ligase family protein [Colwellia sp.]|nr:O-antigen ligase family protein [Colwellia sp.]
MEILLIFITLITCIASIVNPWIGVIAYYILGIYSPKSFWPWIFQDSRIAMFVAISTILGLLVAIIQKKIDFNLLNNKQTKMLLLLCIIVNISHFMSPFYGMYVGQTIPPAEALTIFNKTILFYCVSALLINDNRKLMYIIGVLLFTGVIYALWSNKVYFTGEMWKYTDNGRLKGPGLYRDENAFSLLFITSIPLMYFIASSIKNKVLKLSLLACIPLAWHALFLIGSRGALISLLIITLLLAFRSHSKAFGYMVMVGLLFAIVNYGGAIYERSTNTVEAAQMDGREKPLNPRLVTWSAGWEMIKDYPLLGVGIEHYQTAGISYIEGRVQVAHNTLIQFMSQAGVIAGLIYLWFFVNFYKTSKYIKGKSENKFNLNVSNGLFISTIGFFICAIFLNLMITEMLYFLLLINVINLNQVNKELKVLADGEIGD